MMNRILCCLFTLLVSNSMSFAQYGFEIGKTPDLKRLNYSKINPKCKEAKKGLFSENAIYHLWLFGKKAEIPMWVVMDKSSKDVKACDKLFIDRDCDGKIGEEGECFTFKKARWGSSVTIEDWKNPCTGDISKLQLFSSLSKYNKKAYSLFAMMNFSGIRSSFSTETFEPNTPKTACKTWIGFEKPLMFTTYVGRPYDKSFYTGKGEVKGGPRGQEHHSNDRNYVLGYIGTNHSLWYVNTDFLPEGEALISTVFYRDNKGNKRSLTSRLEERC